MGMCSLPSIGINSIVHLVIGYIELFLIEIQKLTN